MFLKDVSTIATSDHQMATTIDIVVCLDVSSSMAADLPQIRSNVFSKLINLLMDYPNLIRLSLIKFRSHVNGPLFEIYPFTSSSAEFEEMINDINMVDGDSNASKFVGEALNLALRSDWRTTDQSNFYHENMVILITDGAPCCLDTCDCADLNVWRLSQSFDERKITLAVVGVEPSISISEDFYLAIANRTGGEYIPLVNASHVLSKVLLQAMFDADTLSQAFRHLNIPNEIELNSNYYYSYAYRRARQMIENCRTISDIRTFYQNRREPIHIDSDENEWIPRSPALAIHEFNSTSWNVLSSTPITDDEGYRTRMPTMASPYSSSDQSMDFSPVYNETDLAWSIETADDVFYEQYLIR